MIMNDTDPRLRPHKGKNRQEETIETGRDYAQAGRESPSNFGDGNLTGRQLPDPTMNVITSVLQELASCRLRDEEIRRQEKEERLREEERRNRRWEELLGRFPKAPENRVAPISAIQEA